jgi:hypothetical protein
MLTSKVKSIADNAKVQLRQKARPIATVILLTAFFVEAASA